ncbi:MAG: metallophosphoesterase, partial [Candidatus Micrarchaeota archaeon]
MEAEQILKRFAERDVLLTPGALELLQNSEDAEGAIERILASELFVVDEEAVKKFSKKEEEKKIPLPVEVHRSSDFKPLAREHSADIRFDPKGDVTRKSKCTGTVEDFVGYFRDRHKRLGAMLRARQSAGGVVPLKSLKGYAKGTEVRIVGMVSSKRITKKGHLLLELEDEEKTAKVLALKSEREPERTTFENAGKLLLDEVIAVDGRVSDPFVIARELMWPDVPIRAQSVIKEDLCVALMSDLHVGSRFFLEENFQRMLNWLNGGGEDAEQRALAGRVKYVLMAGDIVDGIGIYPHQEKELVVRDIYEQYHMFARFIEDIPDYVEVVVSPGNHDAVRRAEPQPALPDELLGDLKGRGNVHLVGNPSMLEIEGLKTLVYHGTSLDSIIASLPGLSYQYP